LIDGVDKKIFHKRVLIIQRRMTTYRIPLFDKMRARLAQDGITLSVVYGTPMKSEVLRADQDILPWGLRVPCRYWLVGTHSMVFQPIPRDVMRKQDLIIIPHENRLFLTNLQAYLYASSESRIAFFGHGTNFQARVKNSYANKFKDWTTAYADWFFAYTALTYDRVASIGFPKERIISLNNTIDVNSLLEWQKSIAPDELYALRKTLGLKSDHIGVFIGSLYKDKLLDFLFLAADELRRRLPDFELVLIGDGPFCRQINSFVKKRPWAFWVGAKHGREKVLHISLGKVMLNPGLVGLSILDSFALGVPMVTTDCGFHSPEIVYLESGKNGFMVAVDVEEYVSVVARLLTDDEARAAMISAGKEDAQRYSLDAMVKNFCNGISLALKSPKNSGDKDSVRS
jgi:glycosyltransferase involved in cell wall biosynthesis